MLLNGFDEKRICIKIFLYKDVDGFYLFNVGMVVIGIEFERVIKLCIFFGIIEFLKRENIEIKGKYVVVIGRSNIVGKFLVLFFLRENVIVIICYLYIKGLKDISR